MYTCVIVGEIDYISISYVMFFLKLIITKNKQYIFIYLSIHQYVCVSSDNNIYVYTYAVRVCVYIIHR